MRKFNIGDRIICSESGVIGNAIKFYIPTACEEQTMVNTDDGRKYHAPTRLWVLCGQGYEAVTKAIIESCDNICTKADQESSIVVSADILVKHDYRDIKLGDGVVVTIDLEDIKKNIERELYKDFDIWRGLRFATD